MNHRLKDIFNLPNLPFAGRSILAVGDFHQLHPIRAMLVYASSLDGDYPESYIANDLWRLFNFAELTEIIQQRGDKHFIDILNKLRVGNVIVKLKEHLKQELYELVTFIIQNMLYMYLLKMFQYLTTTKSC